MTLCAGPSELMLEQVFNLLEGNACVPHMKRTRILGDQGWNAMSPYFADVYVAILMLKDDGIRWNL